MRTRSNLALLLVVLATSAQPACAPPPPASPSSTGSQDILPLRTLRLYETGVGYFERSGTLGARSATSLPVPAGQLDDALTSLVVLSSGGGTVTGLAFASSVTRATARSRAGLPADPSAPIEFRDLLMSMKGEKVAVVTRAVRDSLEGRVVEVGMEIDEARARVLAESKAAKTDESPKHLVVTILSDAGTISLVAAEDILRIHPVDPAFAARLDAALDALGTRSAQNTKSLRLLGDARGQVTFGYVAETPIWRASYRLVQSVKPDAAGASAVLQGWALLHNDTDESWHDLHLELVNGEPDSFVFPMAAPRYARRALVHPDAALSTLPQLQGTTADALWGDHLDETSSTEGYGEGFGSGHGRLGGSHQASSPSLRLGALDADGLTTGSSLLDVGNLAGLAPATGVEQGAQFVYAVPDGFSLDAHASALVPFVQRGVSVESVSFFSAPGAAGRAAVRFVNSTGQTLPTGTISVFGAGGFTGETSLDRLKPGERRFLQIGNDLDTEVTRGKVQRREDSKRLTFEGDRLNEHFLRTTEETWELENRAASARTLYVALAADKNAKVTGVDRMDFDEAKSQPVVVFDVKAKDKTSRTFTVVEGLSRGLSLDGVTEKVVRSLTQKATIPAAETAVLQQALGRVQALEAARAQITDAERAVHDAQADLERLREDLKALGGGSATSGGTVAAPLVKRVLEAEDRLVSAQKANLAATKARDDRREALRQALQRLAPHAQD
jgi:hypothetical protein